VHGRVRSKDCEKKNMENHKRVERELLEQCGQITILVEYFAWLQRCDECFERLEEFCQAFAPLDKNNPWWRRSRNEWVQRHNCSDVSYNVLLIASGKYANDNERSHLARDQRRVRELCFDQ